MTRRRESEPIYSAAIVAGRGLFGFWRLKRHVTGVEHVPTTGGAVLAMTHFGYLDFALVEWVTWLANRRRIRFMAKQGAFDTPVVGWLLRGMRHIAVDMKAGAAAYAKAVAALRSGELLGVFPEAGVSASFTVRELKTGAVRLAAEAAVPVIPVAVWGGQRLLTKRRRIRFRERFGVPVAFSFGAPIVVGADEDPHVATDRLRTSLQGLVDELQRRYPVDGAGAWWQPRSLGGTAPTPDEAAAADAERDAAREAARHAAREETPGAGS
jgi:1-acyl-sn-glycerol-3-phosphate acyltransferase